MPKAVEITFEAFSNLENGLLSMRFREISRREMMTIVIVHGLIAIKEVVKGEVGFEYFENGLRIVVWTSCVREKVEECRSHPLISQKEIVGRPTGTDAGWILIVGPDNRAQYFARPVMRTKNFVKRFLRRAWLAQHRIKYRPTCRQCQKFMVIRQKKTRATFWACFQRRSHIPAMPTWRDWDCSLGPKAKKIAVAERREFHRYLRNERAKGHEPQRASEIRKPRYIATKNPYVSAA